MFCRILAHLSPGQNDLPTWGQKPKDCIQPLCMALKEDLDLPKNFTFCYYCQQVDLYLSDDQKFLFTVGFFVHLLVSFCSCIMYPDSSGKLIRLAHICQPASFSVATVLKALNTKSVSTRSYCSYYLDFSVICSSSLSFLFPKWG